MSSGFDEIAVARLAQARHAGLLRALLKHDQLKYEELSKLTDRSDAALKTQFSRWQSLGIDLIEKVGKIPAEGKGRPVEVFRLISGRRKLVESALETIEANLGPADFPTVDSLPQVKEIETLWWGCFDESSDLSVRFYKAVSACEKFRELRNFLTHTECRALGFRPADSLLARIDIRVDDALAAADDVRGLIKKKQPKVMENEQKLLNHTRSARNERLTREEQFKSFAGYFDDMPAHSVSGYGGALCARAASADCARLDDYLDKEFSLNGEFGAHMREGFSHVLTETLELAQIESSWSACAAKMYDGAAISVPLAELPALQRASARFAREVLAVETSQESQVVPGASLASTIGHIGQMYLPRESGRSMLGIEEIAGEIGELPDFPLAAAG